jgi:hypothetical protein
MAFRDKTMILHSGGRPPFGVKVPSLVDKDKPFYLAASQRQTKNDSLASFLPTGRQVRLCGEDFFGQE